MYRWRAAFARGGAAALESLGPLGQRCRLSAKSQVKLAAMVDEGPAAHGWDEDQCWTGARVATLIGRKFHVSYSPGAAARLMRRLGFTPQQPIRRAVQRDQEEIIAWKESMSERDYIGLIDAAHQQLKAPIILIWDRLNTHRSKTMTQMVAARDWLTVVLLPPYAPDLNPAEGVWSHFKRNLANLAAITVDRLEALVRTRLKRLQYRATVLDGFLAETGLTFEPQPP